MISTLEEMKVCALANPEYNKLENPQVFVQVSLEKVFKELEIKRSQTDLITGIRLLNEYSVPLTRDFALDLHGKFNLLKSTFGKENKNLLARLIERYPKYYGTSSRRFLSKFFAFDEENEYNLIQGLKSDKESHTKMAEEFQRLLLENKFSIGYISLFGEYIREIARFSGFSDPDMKGYSEILRINWSKKIDTAPTK